MRWTAGRKADVVEDVLDSVVSLEATLKAYGLSIEEFDQWKRRYIEHGLEGLKTTKLRQYIKKKEAVPMLGCKICRPYGKPGHIAILRPRPLDELAMPPDKRPPAPIVWVGCEVCNHEEEAPSRKAG
jgi:hypothetical protein